MRRGVCWLALLSLWFDPSAASAQAASDADVGRARELFDRGTRALEERRFEQAAQLLRTSLEQVPRASTAFNLAVAAQGANSPVESYTILARLRAGEFGELQPAQLAEVQELQREVQSTLGLVRLRVGGPGECRVTLDGQEWLSRCDAGIAERAVVPGEHEVVLTAEGFRSRRARLVLAPGESSLLAIDLQPQAAFGVLDVSAHPARAFVEIDEVGSAKGRLRRELPNGTYTVSAHHRGRSVTKDVALEPGATLEIDLDVPARPLFQRPWFWVGVGLVGVGTVVAIPLALRERDEPVSDPVFGRVQALRVAW